SHTSSYSSTVPPTPSIYTLSLHDALPIFHDAARPVVVYDVDLDALGEGLLDGVVDAAVVVLPVGEQRTHLATLERLERRLDSVQDRKSTRLNSSHLVISYAVFCLKKKTNT